MGMKDKQFASSLTGEAAKLLNWHVADQYELAKMLASNCGYKLVAEDNERSLEIKNAIELIKNINALPCRAIVLEALEALLAKG